MLFEYSSRTFSASSAAARRTPCSCAMPPISFARVFRLSTWPFTSEVFLSNTSEVLLIASMASMLIRPPSAILASACCDWSVSFTPSATLPVDSLINWVISFAASDERWASLPTSSATTAKPLPCAPARAASTAAFSASKLVCSAISVITPMISEICSDDCEIACIPFTVEAMVSWPSVAASSEALPCSCAWPTADCMFSTAATMLPIELVTWSTMSPCACADATTLAPVSPISVTRPMVIFASLFVPSADSDTVCILVTSSASNFCDCFAASCWPAAAFDTWPAELPISVITFSEVWARFISSSARFLLLPAPVATFDDESATETAASLTTPKAPLITSIMPLNASDIWPISSRPPSATLMVKSRFSAISRTVFASSTIGPAIARVNTTAKNSAANTPAINITNSVFSRSTISVSIAWPSFTNKSRWFSTMPSNWATILAAVGAARVANQKFAILACLLALILNICGG